MAGEITFEWDGRSYMVEAAESNRILLADTGELLKCNGWVEISPETPNELTSIGKVLIEAGTDIVAIANNFEAILAVRVRIFIEKDCPNGDKNQTDIFCSKCGARIRNTRIVAVLLPAPAEVSLRPAEVTDNTCSTCHNYVSPTLHPGYCDQCGQVLFWPNV
jgi:hypothetical protein